MDKWQIGRWIYEDMSRNSSPYSSQNNYYRTPFKPYSYYVVWYRTSDMSENEDDCEYRSRTSSKKEAIKDFKKHFKNIIKTVKITKIDYSTVIGEGRS